MVLVLVLLKAIVYIVLFLIIVMTIGLVAGLFAPWLKPKQTRKPARDAEEENIRRLKLQGVLVVAFFLLLSPYGFSEEKLEAQILAGLPEGSRIMEPSEVYEMQGGANQQPEQEGIPIYGSPEWYERKAQFDKYEYKTPDGLSHWYGDGDGNFLTKEEFQAHNDRIHNEMMSVYEGRLSEMRGYVKDETGQDAEVTKEGIRVINNMQRDLKQLKTETSKKIDRNEPLVERPKPKVLVSE